MRKRKLPDLVTIDAYQREYIINTHGSIDEALKTLCKGGKYEQLIEKYEHIENELKKLGR
jgi:hypothetical protein